MLDICLKRGVSGFAVMECIHQQKGCAQLPVILLTADPEPEWVHQGMGMGAANFLVKPLAPVTTRNRLKAIIAQCWGTEEEQNADVPPGKISLQQAEILTRRWQQKFLDFYHNRDITFSSYVQRLRIITSALSNAYCELFPEAGLLPCDAKLISMVTGFAEVGQPGLPDEIVRGGPNQLEPGRTQFFLHTKLGAELFKDCPHEWEPLTTCCVEIAAYRHASCDASRKALENIFRTMHLRKRMEDVEKKFGSGTALLPTRTPSPHPPKTTNTRRTALSIPIGEGPPCSKPSPQK